MNEKDIALINTVIQNALPAVLAAIRAHQQAKAGEFPTLAEVMAALGNDTAAAIATDTAWLAAHPTA